ncbi:MAG: SpoIID/LytB domain-containing protein [Oscillospiraceae bacterium]|jgi:stage II sporulation protein D|nr:SpoIID/LytB domain-containing protein [Oscillospiraceae bacterium]
MQTKKISASYRRTLYKRILCAAAAAAFIGAMPAGQAADNPVLRIGLFYNTTALPTANLENHTGSGYRFGYLQDGRSFVEVGRTTETKITMVKNRNVYMKGGVYYDDAPPAGSMTIGCYHVDAGVSFGSFDEARSRADTLRGQGHEAFPAYDGGDYRVRVGAYASTAAAGASPAAGLSGARVVTGSAYCVSVVQTGTGAMVFQFDGGASVSLAVHPSLGDTPVPITWFKGYRYYGGFEYRRASGNNMTVVNWVTTQDYVKGVIPYEMNPSWPLEALKAQAICAKSYAAANLSKHREYGFDLCATTDCQVYHGTGSASANSDRAVDETMGYYAYHGDKVASTVYHSSNGGSTESAVNVWGTDVAYLRAVPDNFEDLSRAVNGIWSFTYTNSDITKILRDKGYSTGAIVDAYVDEYTSAGNVYRVTFVDALGQKHNFERERARTVLNSSALNLYTHSQRYTISSGAAALTVIGGAGGKVTKNSVGGLYAVGRGGVAAPLSGSLSDLLLRAKNGLSSLPSASTGQYLISGRGWGHNVGMSQYGAKGMAEQGYRFEDIIKYYFQNVEVRS